MARVQSWMIGLAVLLWVSVCAGDAQYVEPAPGEVAPDEPVYTVTDPKLDGEQVSNAGSSGDSTVTNYVREDGYGVTYAEAGEGYVGDSGSNGDYMVTSVGADESQNVADLQNGSSEIVVLVATEGSDGPEMEPAGILTVLKMAPSGTFDVIGSGVDIGSETATLIAGTEGQFTPAEYQPTFVATVGLSGHVADLAGMHGNITAMNWSNMPAMAQIRENVGLGLMPHVATCGNLLAGELFGAAAPYNAATSHIIESAAQVFTAIEIPESAGFLANQ